MSDSHSSEAHHGPSFNAYLVVFGALAVFTLVSFVANYAASPERMWITAYTSFAIILIVAVVKTTLVGAFFMHLMMDWGKVYFMIVPAFILATMMIVVLLPDIVLAWR